MSARLISECCGKPPLGEVVNGWGMCSGCRDHAHFPAEAEPFCTLQVAKVMVGDKVPQKGMEVTVHNGNGSEVTGVVDSVTEGMVELESWFGRPGKVPGYTITLKRKAEAT